MSLLQYQGVTGMLPRRSQTKEAVARSQFLPAEIQLKKDTELANKSLDQTQKYYNRMGDIARDSYEAEKADRRRGLWMQGGLLGFQGLNALGTMEQAAPAVEGAGKAIETFSEIAKPIDMLSSNPVPSTFNTVTKTAGAAGDFLIDPIISGAKKLGGFLKEGGSMVVDTLSKFF